MAVLKNLGLVMSVVWHTFNAEDRFIVAGDQDNPVRVWQIQKEETGWQVRLQWTLTHDLLNVFELSIQDAIGLSPINARLLQQRGAVGTPASTTCI
jgi:hypothetical protein